MINIRPAINGDIPAIEAIYTTLFLREDPNISQSHLMFEISERRPLLEAIISANNAVVLLAQFETQILGLMILQQQQTPAQTFLPPYNFAYMIDLAILKEPFVAGIAPKLIDAGRLWADEHNAEYIELGL